jgi:hypothetical protein
MRFLRTIAAYRKTGGKRNWVWDKNWETINTVVKNYRKKGLEHLELVSENLIPNKGLKCQGTSDNNWNRKNLIRVADDDDWCTGDDFSTSQHGKCWETLM